MRQLLFSTKIGTARMLSVGRKEHHRVHHEGNTPPTVQLACPPKAYLLSPRGRHRLGLLRNVLDEVHAATRPDDALRNTQLLLFETAIEGTLYPSVEYSSVRSIWWHADGHMLLEGAKAYAVSEGLPPRQSSSTDYLSSPLFCLSGAAYDRCDDGKDDFLASTETKSYVGQQ